MQHIEEPENIMELQQLAQIYVPKGYLELFWNNGEVICQIDFSWFKLEDMSIRASMELITGTDLLTFEFAFLFADEVSSLEAGFEQNRWSDYGDKGHALQCTVFAA